VERSSAQCSSLTSSRRAGPKARDPLAQSAGLGHIATAHPRSPRPKGERYLPLPSRQGKLAPIAALQAALKMELPPPLRPSPMGWAKE
jgi:hypothetical protein